MGTKTYPSTFTLLIMMLLKKIPKHGDENTNADDIPVTTQNRLKKIPKHGDENFLGCEAARTFQLGTLKKDPQTWGRVVKELRAAVRRSSSA